MKKILLPTLVIYTVIAFAFTAKTATAQEQKAAQITITSALNKTLRTGETTRITWSTEGLTADALLSINLIQQVSDTPRQYELVRQIASNTLNDGEETWVPTRADSGKQNLYIEIACAEGPSLTNGCSAGMNEKSFAVRGSFSRNLANAISAFFGGLRDILFK